jgi:predicted alpha/beta superfamily hydrolase
VLSAGLRSATVVSATVVSATVVFATVAGCNATPTAEAPCAPTPSAIVTASSSNEPRKLVIDNSQVLELSSELTGRDYELIVGLPPSYADEPERTYPVLYLLDGQWDFNLINTLSGGLRYDKTVPEFLTVGISYGGHNPDYGKLRGEDYTPTRSHPSYAEEPYGGDGPKFLTYLEQTILPTIEQRYRVDASHRIVSGSSLGGLFSLYAFFEKPELFHSIISISPAAGWDDRYLFKREREFQAAHPALNHRIWLSVGDSEWAHFTQSAKEFFEQFEASAYDGVNLKVRIVEGERHAGVKPEAYNRALRWVFKPWGDQQPYDN